MTTKVMTTLELLQRAKTGDTRAMEDLLARHEVQVYRFGLRMCGNEADARDVLQDTLLTAFKNLSSFRGDAQLSTWLYQIARSFCLKQRRRHAGEPEQLESLESDEVKSLAAAPAAEGVAHARQVGEVVQLAMESLPLEAREVLVLRDVEGLSAQEAADVIGIDVGALKSRLHRARMALKEKLASVLEAPEDAVACPELAQELSAYAGSDIDQAACASIEAHLAKCPRCAAACDSLKRTVSLCRAIPGGEVPASVKAAVRQALRSVSAR